LLTENNYRQKTVKPVFFHRALSLGANYPVVARAPILEAPALPLRFPPSSPRRSSK